VTEHRNRYGKRESVVSGEFVPMATSTNPHLDFSRTNGRRNSIEKIKKYKENHLESNGIDKPTDEAENSEHKSYMLPKIVEFGFHHVCSDQIQITEDGLKAQKRDPHLHYAHGVAYGARALRGTSEFEVTLKDYGTGWSGTLKLGVAKFKSGHSFQVKDIPRYSPEGMHHCVWSSDKIHNRLHPNQPTILLEKRYGKKNLDELVAGDRLGLRLSSDGRLVFFVNGKHQGLAAEKVYEVGCDVFPVVDHYANCKATVVTRAGKYEEALVVCLLLNLLASHFTIGLNCFSVRGCIDLGVLFWRGKNLKCTFQAFYATQVVLGFAGVQIKGILVQFNEHLLYW